MSAVAIRASGLGKRYRIGGSQARYRTLRESLTDALAAPLRRLAGGGRDETSIWALQDVSFEIAEGEVVGVIGRNGAGKSTLLKILSRITAPTAGELLIHGRVGSLLEVGTGFHPELTGRENIFLNGAILGMRRSEIERRFDEIVAFSEVEKFIDTPMKHFSTGMFMRLAFAVAAHLEPDLLLVDEVLAVGDAAFQKKCLGRMSEVGRQGRTVLFVSHDMAAISGLTRRTLWLDGGRLRAHGPTAEVIEAYLAESLAQRSTGTPDLGYYRRPGGDDRVRIRAAWVDEARTELARVEMGKDFRICVELELQGAIEGATMTCVLKDAQGRRVTTFFSPDQGFPVTASPGRHVLELKVGGLPLSPGHYLVDLGINQSTGSIAWDVILDYPLCVVEAERQVVHWRERPWGAVHWSRVEWSLGPA